MPMKKLVLCGAMLLLNNYLEVDDPVYRACQPGPGNRHEGRVTNDSGSKIDSEYNIVLSADKDLAQRLAKSLAPYQSVVRRQERGVLKLPEYMVDR